jgi:putative endonuclease
VSERRRQAESRGRMAETLAVLLLRLKGYRILARRLRLPAGEIDIVAARGRTLAFIEVKARGDFTAATWSLTPRQRRRLLGAAGQFMARDPRHGGADLRFDLMLVAPRSWPRHVVDAWRADEAGTE